MTDQQNINYYRIAAAIEYIKTNFKHQPDLDEVAKKIDLSPFHFQRLFVEWAGTSPKKFLQHVTVEYAKDLLKKNQLTLFETAYQSGLSGTGRLHDLFTKIEGMTPAEYKNNGKGLLINYSYAKTLFGDIIIASTAKGICYLAFEDHKNNALSNLEKLFSNAVFTEKTDLIQENALKIFKQDQDTTDLNEIKLHLKGTDFQLKVWQMLLKIPVGTLSTYGAIAQNIQNYNASRAVGTAIGSNPVAFLIPCHRVIQSSGNYGGYMWGEVRKMAIIGWEGIKTDEKPYQQIIDF